MLRLMFAQVEAAEETETSNTKLSDSLLLIGRLLVFFSKANRSCSEHALHSFMVITAVVWLESILFSVKSTTLLAVSGFG